MAWTTEHVTFKAVFCSTHLQTQACITVVSGVTLNFVDFASLLAFWVKKSKQWPVHDTRSVSNTFFVDFASLLAFWVKKSKQWPVHDTRSVSNTFSFITDQ